LCQVCDEWWCIISWKWLNKQGWHYYILNSGQTEESKLAMIGSI
jgi:hypothetical protein